MVLLLVGAMCSGLSGVSEYTRGEKIREIALLASDMAASLSITYRGNGKIEKYSEDLKRVGMSLETLKLVHHPDSVFTAAQQNSIDLLFTLVAPLYALTPSERHSGSLINHLEVLDLGKYAGALSALVSRRDGLSALCLQYAQSIAALHEEVVLANKRTVQRWIAFLLASGGATLLSLGGYYAWNKYNARTQA